jgi:hypothetical protein
MQGNFHFLITQNMGDDNATFSLYENTGMHNCVKGTYEINNNDRFTIQ